MQRILLVVAMWMACAGVVRAASPAEDAQGALAAMHAWLGDDERGQQWKRFLKSDELAREIARGEQADRAKVLQILMIYEGETPGLDRPRFVQVRDALRRLTSQLAESPANLPEAIRAAKGHPRPITATDLASSKAKLVHALQQLERFLGSDGEENAAAWKRYLEWDAMQAELAKENPSLEVLNRALVQYRENREGLELPQFTDVRAALLNYMNQLLFATSENFAQTFDEKIEELAKLVENYPDQPSPDDALALGRALGWFERTGQIPQLTQAIRARYSHPNLFISASQRFVAAGIQSDVLETQAVRDTILGTRINATATMSGHVDAALSPNAEQAAIDITLRGAISSDNVGHNRGVTIYSTGYTTVDAAKRVYIDADGLSSNRAAARASTSTNITGVNHPLRLVRKIAWGRIRQSKSQAERIAAGKAAGRVASRVDVQAGDLLSDANERFAERFRAPLLRRDSFPELLQFSTTHDHLLVQLRHAGPFQIAAPHAAPEVPPELDLAARVHESAVGNFSESLLGGVQLTDERIVELYQENELEVPPDLQLTQDSEPWAITFSRTQPIRAEFVEGGTKVIVSCLYLHQGAEYERVNLVITDEETNRRYSPEIRIARDYTVNVAEGAIRLDAKSDLSIEFIGLNGQPITKYGLLHTSAKSLLTKKFGAMLGERIPRDEREGLQLPGRWEKAGTMKARLAQAAHGWLSIGWEQTAEKPSQPSVAQDSTPDQQPLVQTASAQP